MRTILAIAFVAACLVGGYVFFVRGERIPVNLDGLPSALTGQAEKAKPASEWTESERVADPIGYYEAAAADLGLRIAGLEGEKQRMVQGRLEAERLFASAESQREALMPEFATHRDAYRAALGNGSWPADVGGQRMERAPLESRLLEMQTAMDRYDSEMQQARASQSEYSRGIRDIDASLVKYNDQRAEVLRRVQLAKAQRTRDEANRAFVDLDDTLSNSLGSDLDFSTSVPEHAIGEERRRSEDDERLRGIALNFDGEDTGSIDLSRGPFFDDQGRALVWYLEDENGDYEFSPRPRKHPESGREFVAVTKESAEAIIAWREGKDRLRREQEERARVAAAREAAVKSARDKMNAAADRARAESDRWERFSRVRSVTADSEEPARASLNAAESLARSSKYDDAARSYEQAYQGFHLSLRSGARAYSERLVSRLNAAIRDGSVRGGDVDRNLNARLAEIDEVRDRGDFEAAAERYDALFSPYIVVNDGESQAGSPK